jgi:thiol-disulfide isomerase/thioredoxin
MKSKAIYFTIGISFILMQLLSNDVMGQTQKDHGRTKMQALVTYITGHLETGNLQDIMILDILEEFDASAKAFSVDRQLMQVTKSGDFKFVLPALDRPVYFNLHTPTIKGTSYSDWRNHLLEYYLLMPGDSVHIKYLEAEKRVVFSGKSEAQFSWIYETQRQIYQKTASLSKAWIQKDPEEWLANEEIILNLALSRLPLLEKLVLPDTYRIMTADVIGMYLGSTYMNLGIFDLGAAYKDSVITGRTIKAYEAKLHKQVADTTSSELLASSRFYASYLLNRVRTEYQYKRLMGLSHPADFFSELKNAYPSGILKEKMVMAYLFERIAGSAITDRLISEALAMVHTPRYRNTLLEMKNTHGKGSRVENTYVFKDKVDKPVRLSDFKGKVVFVDMWFTGCAGCVAVAKSLPEVEKEFHNNPNVVFISLSIDKDKSKWMRSIAAKDKPLNANNTIGYTHYTTADAKYIYTGGSGSDHPFIRKYNPTGTYPHLLIIDKAGGMFSSDVPRPDAQEGKEKLISLIRNALNQK